MAAWWAAFQHHFYISFVQADRWQLYIKGLGTTLLLTIIALGIGILLGVLIAVVRSAHDQQDPSRPKNPVLGFFNAIGVIYVTVIRGTPSMVQLMIMYFVSCANSRNQVAVAALAFGINSGAYVAEIIRGGIMAVDRGQMEAGRSLGFNYSKTMRLIIIPQAFKIILPALGNELITLVKETSIVTVIGCVDLLKAAQLIGGKIYYYPLPLFGVALVYLIIVMLLTWLFGGLERRLRADER